MWRCCGREKPQNPYLRSKRRRLSVADGKIVQEREVQRHVKGRNGQSDPWLPTMEFTLRRTELGPLVRAVPILVVEIVDQKPFKMAR